MAKTTITRDRKPDSDWEKIKFEYTHSVISVGALAKKHGVLENTLFKRLTREGWQELRIKSEQEMFSRAAATVARERVVELSSFNADDLKVARGIRAKVAALLSTAPDKTLTATELRQLAGAAEVAQRMGRLALGASTDNLGVSGQNGEGPINIAHVSKDEYIKAREEVLQEF